MGQSHTRRAAVETLCCLTVAPTHTAMQFSRLVLALSLVISLAICAPQGRSQNSNNSPNTRFFTGNQALDSAAAGAALGLGASVLSNQILSPFRGGTRNSNQNQNTNTRIFGNNAATNGIFGAVAGFLGGQVAQNVLGNPCG